MSKDKITFKMTLSPFDSTATNVSYTEDALEMNNLTANEVAQIGSAINKVLQDKLRSIKEEKGSNLTRALARKAASDSTLNDSINKRIGFIT